MTDAAEATFAESLYGKAFDGWVIDQPLGHGQSGVVFLATQGERTAAVKVYWPAVARQSSDADQLRRIQRQVALKDLQHPSLVRIYSGGRDLSTGHLFLVMAHVSGRPLDKVLLHVPVPRIRPLLAQIASAARFLELHDIVHGDIRPAKIIVDHDFKRATVLDLGVIRPLADAKSHLNNLSSTHGLLDAIRHSPPELLEHLDDERTSEGWRAITFYQLGTVASGLITGRGLFPHIKADDLTIFDAVRSETPDLADMRTDVSGSLCTLARDCLLKNWSERLAKVTWEAFEYRRFVRRPIVVLVYTGGTIGATVERGGYKTRLLRPVQDKTAELLMKIKRRVLRDYAQLAGPDVPIPFDLEWEVLPAQQQLLSENASDQTWGHLGDAVERICKRYARPKIVAEDQQDEYLAGIVFLHGTDTLAYSAAALSLSLRNLPCPVILTGSNQPPNENSIFEQDLISSESDAWKNILRSLHFIQTFGHRFTEVFVCFHDTVHVAVNLRKSAIDRAPQPLQRERKMEEPYYYRNRGPQRQYAYRVIDGLYCNNLYPISTELKYDVLIHDPVNRYRHIRRSPWAPKRPLVREKFAAGVRVLSASPIPFLPMRVPRDLRILLLEGYSSGTFPTAVDHPFHSFLVTLQRRAIPVVLVTRNGLVSSKQRYEMAKIEDMEMPVLRLFGVIAETAAPLLSLILKGISMREWNAGSRKGPAALLKGRHELLESAIQERQSEPDGILSALLGDVLDEEGRRNARIEEVRHLESEHLLRVTDLFAEARPGRLPKIPRGSQSAGSRAGGLSFNASMTEFPRQHFLWLLGEVIHSFESSNCGPDGLALWNELGFAWGREMLQMPSQDQDDNRILYSRRTPEQRKESFEAAERQTEIITQFLFDYGVAEVTATAEIVREPTEARSFSDGQLCLNVGARKHGRGGRDDDLFAAIGYQPTEARFFRTLREGGDLTLSSKECQEVLEKGFKELFEHAWDVRVSPLDWFLIGTYKAVVISALRGLLFDPWVERCDRDEAGYVEGLRQAIRTEVLVANRDFVKLRLSYTGRRVYEPVET